MTEATLDVTGTGPVNAGPSRWVTILRRLVRTPSGMIGIGLTLIVVMVTLMAGVIAPGDPLASTGPALRPPSGAHWMGTDNFGRDMLAGVVHGLRTSMTVVGWVMTLTLVVGVVVGMVSGYRGGVVDDVLMRITEVFQAIPLFFLALLAVAFFGAGLEVLILLLGLVSWDQLARVVRSESLSLRERKFVVAARACGASDARIVLRHVLPNVFPSAIVVVALIGSRVILIEAALSFIGLGDPNAVSLGSLIFNAQSFLSVAWWMSFFPGAAIAVAVLGLNLVSDVVNDALDPTGAGPAGVGSRRRRSPASGLR
jgi:peptide/nickel transport system permease protein